MDWHDLLTPEQANDDELMAYLEKVANAKQYSPKTDPIEQQLDDWQAEVIAHIKVYGRTYILAEDAMMEDDDEVLGQIYRDYNMQEFNWLVQHGLGSNGLSLAMFARAGLSRLFDLFLEDLDIQG